MRLIAAGSGVRGKVKGNDPFRMAGRIPKTIEEFTDRVNVYIYDRGDCMVLPQNEASVFLTMPHMGDGIKTVEFEILAETPLKPIYRFVAEFRFEENKNSSTILIPFVLVSQTGRTCEVKWEKRGPRVIENLPRI